jgi:hypothetical protein
MTKPENNKGQAQNYAIKARLLKQRALNAKKQARKDKGPKRK